ncbi:MAG: ParB/RepB/Spo0J family partition protein, partial [Actinomycetota bacterium]
MAEDLETVQRIPLGDLHAADDNIRREVGDVSELAASIQSVGILEPLLVSPNAGGYVVVAGARRLAAAKAAGLTEVPAIVREVTDAERVEIGLIENCQRAGLECLEEAVGYRRLIKEFGYTQRVLAKRVGRSQSHIAKRLSLLNLPKDVRAEVDSGGITLPDALELAKLAKTPDRLEKALKRGREYGGIEAAVRRQEQELQQEATQAKMVKDLKALGLTVLDWPDSGRWDTNSPVKPLRNLYWLDADAHAAGPCHAVSVAPYGETVGLCT